MLSVGNLIPIKGHDVLIRAIASLAQEFPSLTLEIIGDGSELSLEPVLQVGERQLAALEDDRARLDFREVEDVVEQLQ